MKWWNDNYNYDYNTIIKTEHNGIKNLVKLSHLKQGRNVWEKDW